MQDKQLIPSLFRTEYSRIVAVLCRHMGMEHIVAAEDIASETFLAALETWSYKGIPDHPSAWLYAVAKNKARNYFARERNFIEKVRPAAMGDQEEGEGLDLSDGTIRDSQLRMLFAVCQPALPAQAQIGLALRLLCGFGIDEIADALLLPKGTVNKQLFRAREKLRALGILPEMPSGTGAAQRLHIVLRTLYLLFSEGYYSERREEVIRKDLCLEAMRLAYLLLDSQFTDDHEANALMALMCYHASRLEARMGVNGEIILYGEQDQSLWNGELIERGNYYLLRASENAVLSKFYLEAQIAYWHTVPDSNEQKWAAILQLYDNLLPMEPSPVAALNRVYALARAKSFGQAIIEAEKLCLTDSFFYHILLGELYGETDHDRALNSYLEALALARNHTEKTTVQSKISKLQAGSGSAML